MNAIPADLHEGLKAARQCVALLRDWHLAGHVKLEDFELVSNGEIFRLNTAEYLAMAHDALTQAITVTNPDRQLPIEGGRN